MTTRTLVILASTLAMLALAGCKDKSTDTSTASLAPTSSVLPA